MIGRQCRAKCVRCRCLPLLRLFVIVMAADACGSAEDCRSFVVRSVTAAAENAKAATAAAVARARAASEARAAASSMVALEECISMVVSFMQEFPLDRLPRHRLRALVVAKEIASLKCAALKYVERKHQCLVER